MTELKRPPKILETRTQKAAGTGGHRWRAKAHNGRTIGASTEEYSRAIDSRDNREQLLAALAYEAFSDTRRSPEVHRAAKRLLEALGYDPMGLGYDPEGLGSEEEPG